MQQAIYSVYVILPILLLWGAKFTGFKKFNDEFLSIKQTKAFQGFLAVCIMLHHIAQKTCASWIYPPSRIVHGLDIFVDMGFLLVSVFLFFNGYGVYKSFHAKDNYLKGYFKKRILPVVLALYTTTFIFFIARLLVGEKMNGEQIRLYLTSIQLCNPNTWYVIVLPFFYLFFYISFRFIKKDGLAVAATCALVIAYMLYGTTVDHNDYWIRGEWWYNCVILFPVGIVFAKFEKKIIPHVQKFYWFYLILFLAAYYPIRIGVNNVANMFGYYGEGWIPQNIVVMNRRITLAAQSVLCTWFVMCWLLLGMKVKIGNAFIKFMGTITLEFYLIHGLYVELFGWQFDGGVPSPHHIKYVIVYVLVVFALGVPSAILLQNIHHVILGKKKLRDIFKVPTMKKEAQIETKKKDKSA
ncbi:Membrane-bound acyltransferase YfiQ, involved in biofilm formation [Butyrivibrio fibrisolvens DSM 3071]|uniref:Membrane-bound acyltransferase YfiQ, involved in biofilm formation n=1 Tax=Butyrivibrio fibrisolvens DSM 3071 TaxID=1121131 RepID=A0A1M5YZY9_BUTFI|nr:acyltransferase [Butyrivibrio fibrisolvens]SHI17500.1 Membrane-bound acyltransferase YfiQ, involved in biofilm formation [Butyrivibrio fibrisolvens DSM 3071]